MALLLAVLPPSWTTPNRVAVPSSSALLGSASEEKIASPASCGTTAATKAARWSSALARSRRSTGIARGAPAPSASARSAS